MGQDVQEKRPDQVKKVFAWSVLALLAGIDANTFNSGDVSL